MRKPRLVIRLDIDTIVCMCPGVENLLALAEEKGVFFTFFANMGRAVCYRSTLRRIVSRGQYTKRISAVKLSSKDKLGLKGLLATLMFNREVGNEYSQTLTRVVSEGHDLGLHGGKNHGEWHHNADTWCTNKVKDEIEWGVSAMRVIGLPAPVLFASPGFTTPSDIVDILSDFGFKALADDHSDECETIYPDPRHPSFKHANTRALGEPGAVGYIESVIANGQGRNEIEKDIKARVFHGEDVILYDHPCMAGRYGLGHLSHIIDTWVKSGGEVVPLRKLIE